MNSRQRRQAERLYIVLDYSLNQIAEELSIAKSELEVCEAEWEYFRQCVRTAEYLYVRHDLSLEEIAQTIPIQIEKLRPYQAEWDQMKQHYLAPLPAALAKTRQMIEKEVQAIEARLKPRPSMATILKLHKALQVQPSFLDQVEIFLNIFTQNFLPILHISEDQRTFLIGILARFRKFVALQLLSGDR